MLSNILSAFDFGSIFNELSLPQLIFVGAAVGLALVVGLLIGGCAFYSAGYKRRKKIERLRARNTAAIVEKPQEKPQEPVQDTFDKPEEEDIDYFDWDEEDDEEEGMDAPVVEALPESADEEEQRLAAVLEDPVFAELVAQNRARKPIVNRKTLLAYCSTVTPLADSLPFEVKLRTKEHYYDCLQCAGRTFGLVFGRRKVLKVFLRLRANAVEALVAKAGAYVNRVPALGNDWYSWIVTDVDHNEKILAKLVEVGYKYTAHSDFARMADGTLKAKNEGNEDKIMAFADSYDRNADPALIDASDAMNAKYKLECFSKSDACQFVESWGKEGVVATD
ncbi:MAG: hypothetical protein J5755_06330, partial [Clostridia bacterium]|nr:hypothetical protein [Clostridia bacterium]